MSSNEDFTNRIPAAGATQAQLAPSGDNLVPCFTPGTLIATPQGEKPVESLKPGDRVLTRDNGLQEIRWMGSCRLTAEDLRQAPRMRPVRIRSGVLDHGLPESDIVVSPWHRILIQSDRAARFFGENEVLSAAGHLTAMAGVEVLNVTSVTYIHFMFDQHQVVLSNGFWTESFHPDHRAVQGLGDRQRRELFELFPDLRHLSGRKARRTARRDLSEAESRLLLK